MKRGKENVLVSSQKREYAPVQPAGLAKVAGVFEVCLILKLHGIVQEEPRVSFDPPKLLNISERFGHRNLEESERDASRVHQRGLLCGLCSGRSNVMEDLDVRRDFTRQNKIG